MNQQLKALISTRAKKFIATLANYVFVTNFYFKGTQQFTGCFPNHDWLCHPWPPFVYRGSGKKVAKGDKANHTIISVINPLKCYFGMHISLFTCIAVSKLYTYVTAYLQTSYVYVTRSAKTRHNCAFCISRNTNFKYSICCNYLMPQCMDTRFTV